MIKLVNLKQNSIANVPLKIESEINRLRLQLEALKDKTIVITAKTIEAKNGGGVVGFATGGQVPGIGNTDTVPAMLTPGEMVINKTRSAYAIFGNDQLRTVE